MARNKEPINIELIKEQVFKTNWDSLKVHVERNQVLSVSPETTLAEVAKLIIDDKKNEVDNLLKKGTILKPSKEMTTEWANLKDGEFNFIIVTPYVLVQVVV